MTTGSLTKSALAAYRDGKRVSKRIRLMYPNGVPAEVVEATAGKLGASLPQCRNLTDEARKRGAANAAKAHKKRAAEAYEDIEADIRHWRSQGLTLQAIADRLNSAGHTTRREAPWNRTQVMRVLDRITTS
jgi:hypothetical protein